MTNNCKFWTFFILLSIGLHSVFAIEILYAEPMTTCAKPAMMFRPYVWQQEGLANVFFGDRAIMRLNPAGTNYNTMVQVVGPNFFQPQDIIDPIPPGNIPSLLETVCSFPYGVIMQGSQAGGIIRYTLPEIEQINGYGPNSMRLETYSATYQYGAINVQTAPAFAALTSGSATQYTSPTVQGPAINLGVVWRGFLAGSILTFAPGTNARITATATPPQGRRIQALYYQEMPSGNIIATNTNCKVSAQCVLTYDFTLQAQARNVHVHAIDDAPVAHVKAILV